MEFNDLNSHHLGPALSSSLYWQTLDVGYISAFLSKDRFSFSQPFLFLSVLSIHLTIELLLPLSTFGLGLESGWSVTCTDVTVDGLESRHHVTVNRNPAIPWGSRT